MARFKRRKRSLTPYISYGRVLEGTIPPPPPVEELPPDPVLRGPIFIPGPWPKTEKWTVVHYDHTDAALGDCNPQSPEFAIYLNKVGYLNYSLDSTHDLCHITKTEPYGTDFKLFRGKTPVMGGLHTDIQIDDIETHSFQVSGKDWSHYIDTRFWPFDPADPTGNLYLVTDRDVFDVVKDLLDEILALSNSPVFTYSFLPLSGQLVDYKIDVADTTSILSKITELGQKSPGFDAEFTHDRQIRLWAPKKGMQREIVLEQGQNIFGLSYANSGPKGTHMLGTAHAISSQVGAIVDHANMARYRRLDVTEEFGDVSTADIVPALTLGAAERNATPHTEFVCKIIPDFVDDFLEQVSVGDTVKVEGDIGWTEFSSSLRLVSIIGRPDEEGNEEYELGLDDGTISL